MNCQAKRKDGRPCNLEPGLHLHWPYWDRISDPLARAMLAPRSSGGWWANRVPRKWPT